jgi:hypothetical protein
VPADPRLSPHRRINDIVQVSCGIGMLFASHQQVGKEQGGLWNERARHASSSGIASRVYSDEGTGDADEADGKLSLRR